MKTNFLILLFLMTSFVSYSQTLRNDKYELYLIKFEENEVTISQGMYMTDRAQSYFEGVIEVTYMGNGETKKYNFFFSTWDNNFKEFQVKNSKFEVLMPKIIFKNNSLARIKDTDSEEYIKLEDTSNFENSILSSMVVWLDNQK